MSNARWIWLPETQNVNVYARFCMLFEAKEGKATVRVSVSGEYELHINDRRIGFGQYGDWPQQKTVNTHAVDLHEGMNTFALYAWNPGEDSSCHVATNARVWFSVEQSGQVLLVSGEDTLCTSIAGYQSGEVPKITGQLGFSFVYDANAEDVPLVHARIVEAPERMCERETAQLELEPLAAAKLCAQGVFFDVEPPEALPSRRMQRAALSARPLHEMVGDDGNLCASEGNGLYLLYDLGEETAGYLSFSLETDEPAEILIGFGEHLEDLRVRTSVGGRNFCAVYYSKAGENTFSHMYRRWGCRYLQLHIRAHKVKVAYIGLLPVEYPTSNNSFFTCDDRLHRRIRDISLRTLKLCMHDHYEDCPWREQGLYSMDSRVQMLCGYYALGEKKMPLASLKLLAGGLRKDGLLELCAPAKVAVTIPSFTLIFVVQLWDYVLYTGDLDGVQPLMSTAYTILDGMLNHTDAEGRLLRFIDKGAWNFYEWREGLEDSVVGALTGAVQEKRPEGILTLWYVMALRAVVRLCAEFGNDEMKEKYAMRLQKAKQAAETFWDEEKGVYGAALENGKPVIFAEMTQALALLAEVCTGDRAERLRERLAERRELIPVTFNNALLRYQALLQEERKYIDFVLNDIAETWGKMMYEGATSVWETELGAADFDDAGSLCHAWSAVPIYIYYAYGLGIRPKKPGVYIRNISNQTALGKAQGYAEIVNA